jgi:hypothetical protein
MNGASPPLPPPLVVPSWNVQGQLHIYLSSFLAVRQWLVVQFVSFVAARPSFASAVPVLASWTASLKDRTLFIYLFCQWLVVLARAGILVPITNTKL